MNNPSPRPSNNKAPKSAEANNCTLSNSTSLCRDEIYLSPAIDV